MLSNKKSSNIVPKDKPMKITINQLGENLPRTNNKITNENVIQ